MIGTIFATVVCSVIVIWVLMQVLRACFALAWFAVSMLIYGLIWLFAPRTWREMHDV